MIEQLPEAAGPIPRQISERATVDGIEEKHLPGRGRSRVAQAFGNKLLHPSVGAEREQQVAHGCDLPWLQSGPSQALVQGLENFARPGRVMRDDPQRRGPKFLVRFIEKWSELACSQRTAVHLIERDQRDLTRAEVGVLQSRSDCR